MQHCQTLKCHSLWQIVTTVQSDKTTPQTSKGQLSNSSWASMPMPPEATQNRNKPSQQTKVTTIWHLLERSIFCRTMNRLITKSTKTISRWPWLEVKVSWIWVTHLAFPIHLSISRTKHSKLVSVPSRALISKIAKEAHNAKLLTYTVTWQKITTTDTSS